MVLIVSVYRKLLDLYGCGAMSKDLSLYSFILNDVRVNHTSSGDYLARKKKKFFVWKSN